jgi:RecA/RadA recombinase
MRDKALLDAVKKLNEKSGGSMGRAEALAKRPPSISTGSVDFDIALGGGFQLGRVYSFVGNESCGKTTTTKRISGNGQVLCRRCYRKAQNIVAVPPDEESLKEDPRARWSATGECDCYALGLCWKDPVPPKKEKDEKPKEYAARVEEWREALRGNSYEEFVIGWVDLEQSFEAEWAERLGLDPRRVLLVYPDTAEQVVDLVHALAATGLIDMMVIDSIAQMTPRKEYEESAEDWQQGLLARIMNKGARKWMSSATRTRLGGSLLTQVWINQLREKIGIMFGDNSVEPGGKGQKFAAHVQVRFLKAKVITEEEQFGTKEEKDIVPVREEINVRIAKSKIAGTKQSEASFCVAMREIGRYRPGDVIEDDWLYAQMMHYVAKELKDGYEIVGREFKTQKAVKSAFNEDMGFRSDVVSALVFKRTGRTA